MNVGTYIGFGPLTGYCLWTGQTEPIIPSLWDEMLELKPGELHLKVKFSWHPQKHDVTVVLTGVSHAISCTRQLDELLEQATRSSW